MKLVQLFYCILLCIELTIQYPVGRTRSTPSLQLASPSSSPPPPSCDLILYKPSPLPLYSVEDSRDTGVMVTEIPPYDIEKEKTSISSSNIYSNSGDDKKKKKGYISPWFCNSSVPCRSPFMECVYRYQSDHGPIQICAFTTVFIVSVIICFVLICMILPFFG